MQKNTLMRLSILLTGMVLLFSACKPGQKIWTHDAEWDNPEFKGTKDFHGTVVKNRGNTLLCKVCHGASLQGTAEIRGCYKCHFGPEGSRSPSGLAMGAWFVCSMINSALKNRFAIPVTSCTGATD